MPPSQTHSCSSTVLFWLKSRACFIAFLPPLLFLIASFLLGTGRGAGRGWPELGQRGSQQSRHFPL